MVSTCVCFININRMKIPGQSERLRLDILEKLISCRPSLPPCPPRGHERLFDWLFLTHKYCAVYRGYLILVRLRHSPGNAAFVCYHIFQFNAECAEDAEVFAELKQEKNLFSFAFHLCVPFLCDLCVLCVEILRITCRLSPGALTV